MVLALLRANQSNNSHLEVPHEGKQKDRFTLAMEERNKRIIHEGQPNAVCHACDKCLRIYADGEGVVTCLCVLHQMVRRLAWTKSTRHRRREIRSIEQLLSLARCKHSKHQSPADTISIPTILHLSNGPITMTLELRILTLHLIFVYFSFFLSMMDHGVITHLLMYKTS